MIVFWVQILQLHENLSYARPYTWAHIFTLTLAVLLLQCRKLKVPPSCPNRDNRLQRGSMQRSQLLATKRGRRCCFLRHHFRHEVAGQLVKLSEEKLFSTRASSPQ